MAADYEIGTAHGRIEVDSSSLGKTAASLGFMANRMLLVGGAAVAGFGYAVNAAAEFETQLSRFKAVSDTSEKDLEKVRQKALQLGRDSAFGAREVAEGFVEIGKAGLSAKEILAGVGDAAVYLAAAGELTMADATEILVNTMQQYQLKGKDAVQISNLLAGAANASTAEVDDLAYSLKYAGPMASAFGISLEDTATMLAIFANNGIKGSTAGTSMRSILLGLAAQTPKATKTLKDLGIVTADGTNLFYDMTGKLKPLSQVMQILQDHTKDLSDKDRIAALNTLFLRRALSSALVGVREGATGFEKMKKEIGKTTAEEVMKEKLDNLQGSIKKAKASFETLAIVVGSEFQEPLKQSADRVRDLANWFAQLSPEFRKIIGYALLGFGSFVIFGGIMLKIIEYTIRFRKAMNELGLALKAFSPAMYNMVVAIYAALGPIALIILAILLIAATAYYFYRNWDKIWNWIKDHKAYAAIIAVLAAIFAPFIIWAFVIAAFAKNWKVVWEKVQEVSRRTKEVVLGAFGDVLSWFKNSFLPFFTDTLVNFFKGLPAQFASWANTAVTAFMNFFNDFPNKVSYALGFVLGKLVLWGTQLAFLIWDLLVKAAVKFVEWTPVVLTYLTDLGVQALAAMSLWLLDMAAKMPGWLLETTTKLNEWALDMVNKMIDMGVNMVREAGVWALNVGPQIFNFLNDLPWKMLNLAIGMINAFLAGFNTSIGGIWNFMANLASGFLDRLNAIPGDFFNAGVEAMRGLWQGLERVADHVKDWVGNFAKSMVDKLTSPLHIFSPSKVFMGIGEDVMKGLQIGLENSSPHVLDTLGKTANAMAGFSPVITPTAAGYGSSGLTIGNVVVEVHGVSDPDQAKMAGEAAGAGFVGALERRQIRTMARMV